jgi:hypothetical protein
MYLGLSWAPGTNLMLCLQPLESIMPILQNPGLPGKQHPILETITMVSCSHSIKLNGSLHVHTPLSGILQRLQLHIRPPQLNSSITNACVARQRLQPFLYMCASARSSSRC